MHQNFGWEKVYVSISIILPVREKEEEGQEEKADRRKRDGKQNLESYRASQISWN